MILISLGIFNVVVPSTVFHPGLLIVTQTDISEEAVSWSRDNSPLEIIWLNVYSSNGLGLDLYKNTGFELSGTIKRFFKEEHGYIDKMQMAKQIK